MPCRGAGLPPLDCFSNPAPTHRGAWTLMRKLLLQLDSSRLPSVFDRVVAYDGGADEVMSYGGVTDADVRDLIHGCIRRGRGHRRGRAAARGRHDGDVQALHGVRDARLEWFEHDRGRRGGED